MQVRLDSNGEGADQHIRNALQILNFADTIISDARFPERNGSVHLTADEAKGIKTRLKKALELLTD